jgi:16S rRNA G527 N7-methylase RsmG
MEKFALWLVMNYYDVAMWISSVSGWKFTLLESMQKRCLFLEHAVEVMGLSNVDVVCDRAEVSFV